MRPLCLEGRQSPSCCVLFSACASEKKKGIFRPSSPSSRALIPSPGALPMASPKPSHLLKAPSPTLSHGDTNTPSVSSAISVLYRPLEINNGLDTRLPGLRQGTVSRRTSWPRCQPWVSKLLPCFSQDAEQTLVEVGVFIHVG